MLLALLALLGAIGMAFVVPIAAPPPSSTTKYFPDPGGSLCGEFQPVLGTHGYVESCDSPTFMAEFQHPWFLLHERDQRQSRPLFVLAGTATTALASPVALVVGTSALRLGAQLLNALLLAAAVVIAWALLRAAGVGTDLRVAVTALLVVNDVTKASVWSAHTQMMNIVVPLAVTALAYLVLDRPRMRTARFWLLGLACGLGFLASGFFLVGLPVLVIARLIALRRSAPLTARRSLGEAFGCAIAFAAPVVAWVGAVRLVVGSFYSHETARYRQFVWILDALGRGIDRFAERLGTFSGRFGDTLGTRDLPPVLALAVLIGIAFLVQEIRRLQSDTHHDRRARDLALAAVLTTGGFALFLWLLGYYQPRLTFALAPPLLLIVALQLEQLRRRWPRAVGAAALLTSAVWIVLHVVSAGPYDS